MAIETAHRMTDATLYAEREETVDRGTFGEQSDLLTFEEGLTGHPLSGAYICVRG